MTDAEGSGGPVVTEQSTEATLPLGAAITAGLRQAMEDDRAVMIMGEDVGRLGGVFRVTDGLQMDFGEDRVVDTPLAESGIVGTAVGLAVRGSRPVCEIQFDGFVYPAFNQIVSQLAKFRSRSGGTLPMPVVIRIPYGEASVPSNTTASPTRPTSHTPRGCVSWCVHTPQMRIG